MPKVSPLSLLLIFSALVVFGASPAPRVVAQEATPGVEEDGVTVLGPDGEYAGATPVT